LLTDADRRALLTHEREEKISILFDHKTAWGDRIVHQACGFCGWPPGVPELERETNDAGTRYLYETCKGCGFLSVTTAQQKRVDAYRCQGQRSMIVCSPSRHSPTEAPASASIGANGQSGRSRR